jgi:hypothetical protein
MGARFIPLCALILGSSACVDAFSGSDVQIDFAPAFPRAALAGEVVAPEHPPQDTYYILWASEQSLGADGLPDATYLFDVTHFEIKRLIDLSSPCFIELEDSRFPGLHVTQFANKMSEQTGIVDPLTPPTGASQGDITDVLDAQIRMGHLSDLQNQVEVMTDVSNASYGPSETTCIEDNSSVDQTKFPPAKCIGEQSNANRLKLCRAFWSQHPEYYEGNDKTFTAPLNGKLHGMVEGMNPIGGGFLGGTELFIDSVLTAQGYLVTWQYKDLNGDGKPDFPDPAPPANEQKIGHLLMEGTPFHEARGVTNVTLFDRNDLSISAQMAIFPDLANDGTHF